MASFDLKEYARRGAEARVIELRTELEQIYRTFPEMRIEKPRLKGSQVMPTPQRRRRRRFTPAQKKAVSARMKAYWAARRKAASK